MLKGIPGCLSPELLSTLSMMGHGDDIVLADKEFRYVERLDFYERATQAFAIVVTGEADLVGRIRGIVGDGVPIAAALDFHANNTERFVGACNVICGHRTFGVSDRRGQARLSLGRPAQDGPACHLGSDTRRMLRGDREDSLPEY